MRANIESFNPLEGIDLAFKWNDNVDYTYVLFSKGTFEVVVIHPYRGRYEVQLTSYDSYEATSTGYVFTSVDKIFQEFLQAFKEEVHNWEEVLGGMLSDGNIANTSKWGKLRLISEMLYHTNEDVLGIGSLNLVFQHLQSTFQEFYGEGLSLRDAIKNAGVLEDYETSVKAALLEYFNV